MDPELGSSPGGFWRRGAAEAHEEKLPHSPLRSGAMPGAAFLARVGEFRAGLRCMGRAVTSKCP